MTTSTRSCWLQPLWLLVGGYWTWMVWACAGEWTTSEDYNYGWFVPPLALYFLWKRVESNSPRSHPSVPDPRGAMSCTVWAIIILSLLAILPLELVRQTPVHWRPILWAIGLLAFSNTLAVAWITGGAERARFALFPAFFMLLGIPWPTFLENAMTFPLMGAVTGWSVSLLQFLGYPATAAGNTISLPHCKVGVEEACSGLRSLQTALMVGVAAGELLRLGIVARMSLLIGAFAMALLGNQVRVLLLALAGIGGGNVAVASAHDAAGYTVLAILLSGVGLLAWGLAWWQRLSGGTQGMEEVPHGDRTWLTSAACNSSCAPQGYVVLALACSAMLAAHAWFWWRSSVAHPPSPAILRASADGQFMVDGDVPSSILGVLRPDDYQYIRQSANGVPGKVIGYHFYWNPRKGNANQLYHRPDQCMPGAGWHLDGRVTREMLRVADRQLSFNVFPFRGPTGPALMLWGAFLNGEPVEIEFNSDVYLNTANLWQFIKSGTRLYSYEVAAFIMPYQDGQRPTQAEVSLYANKVFSSTRSPL